MKKIYTLVLLLLAYTSAMAQSTALQFDGNDDYAEVIVNPAQNAFTEEGFTIEIVFQIFSAKQHTLLYHQMNDDLSIEIAINTDNQLYVAIGEEVHISEEAIITHNECHQLSITFFNSEMNLYLDGSLASNYTFNNAIIGFSSDNSIYLGQSWPDNFTTLHGTLDEVRIFTDIRSTQEILAFLFYSIWFLKTINTFI